MGFSAARAAPALDYDFSDHPQAAGQPWAIRGTVPEPTAGRLDAFFAEMRQALGGLTGSTESELLASALTLPAESQEQMSAQMRGALARLCAGSPPPEVIEALPARILDAFRDWLLGELFAPPTSPTAGLSASPAALANAASPTPSAVT